MSEKENTTLCAVSEVGVFGSLNMKDPTANPVKKLMEETNDPYLKAYLAEQMKTGGKQ
jgi:hypothetical protein